MLAYNLMTLAIVGVCCLAAIHTAVDEGQIRSVKPCIANLIASIKKDGRG